MTSDEALAARIFMIANHGQECKYQHRRIGCNSRLDTLQAAVLDVKLKHLEEFTEARRSVARQYDEALSSCDSLVIPAKSTFSTHVYHQYTIQVKGGRRNALQHLLKEQGIPSMIYYPLPVHRQEAYRQISRVSGKFGRLHPFVRIRPFLAHSYGNVPRTTAIYNRKTKRFMIYEL